MDKLKLLFIILPFILSCSCNKKEIKSESIIITVNGVDIEMVKVEGGTFLMGATKDQGKEAYAREKPVREETVSSFYMGKYELTQKQWKAVMSSDTTPSYNKGCDDCPVENVSWITAQRFILRLNVMTGQTFRLPTEVEWEYAARGGNQSKGYKYSGSNDVDDVAWYVNNYKETSFGEIGTTHPVGTKQPNELGIYDMSGNVWEWCNDAYTKDDQGWPLLKTRKVIRGGSWGGTANGCRVAYIDFDIERYQDEYGGFRLVMDIPTEKADSITFK